MEIETAMAEQGVEIDRRKIQLDHPIKTLGEHVVDIKLNAGANASLKVKVLNADQVIEKTEAAPAKQAVAAESDKPAADTTE